MNLGHIVEVQAGYPFRQRIEPSTDGDVAVIQMKDIDDQNVLHTERLVNVRMPALSERYVVKQGDVLFRSRGNRNGAALVGENLRLAVAAAPLMLLRVSDDRVLPAYVRWFINHPKTQARLSNLAAGTYVQTVGKAGLEGMEIPVPPLERQRQIAELADLAAQEQKLSVEISEYKKTAVEGILARLARNTR